jgi:hypothetical protein
MENKETNRGDHYLQFRQQSDVHSSLKGKAYMNIHRYRTRRQISKYYIKMRYSYALACVNIPIHSSFVLTVPVLNTIAVIEQLLRSCGSIFLLGRIDQ